MAIMPSMPVMPHRLRRSRLSRITIQAQNRRSLRTQIMTR
jgi:hypothetical protein